MDRRTALSSLLTAVTAVFAAPKLVAEQPKRSIAMSPALGAPYAPSKGETTADPYDRAHFEWMEQVRALVARQKLPTGYTQMDFIDYDHNRRRLSMAVRAPDGREIPIAQFCNSQSAPEPIAAALRNQMRYMSVGHRMLQGGLL